MIEEKDFSVEPFAGFIRAISENHHRIANQYFEWLRAFAGHWLWQEGDPAESIAIIVSGKIQLLKKHPDNDGLVVGTYSGGSIIGEESCAADTIRLTSAKVVEGSNLLLLNKSSLKKLIRQECKLAPDILSYLLELQANRHASLLNKYPD